MTQDHQQSMHTFYDEDDDDEGEDDGVSELVIPEHGHRI